jgi:Enterobacterial TraT complement resistance protein
MHRYARLLILTALAVALGGCAATQTMIAKKDLDVQSRTSTAIFIDPVPRDRRTIYLDVKSGVMEFDRRRFKQFVVEQFTVANDNGYRIVDDPDTAQFLMVVYVLNLEKASPTAAQMALNQGYQGGAIAGGAIIGAAATQTWAGAGVGGLVGGALELVSSAAVKDVTYMLVSDVQIQEKAPKGVLVRKDTRINTKVSDAGAAQQTSSEVSTRKEYRTRIVTTANKANLELGEAQELMFKKTAYSMAGFF